MKCVSFASALRLSTRLKIHFSGCISPPSRFHPDLRLSEAQVVRLQVAHRPAALQDCIGAIATAEGHLSVSSALSRLSLHLLVDRLALPHSPTHGCRKTLHSLSWQAAMTR